MLAAIGSELSEDYVMELFSGEVRRIAQSDRALHHLSVIDWAMPEQREDTLLSDCEMVRISFALGNSDAVSVEIDKADFVVVRRI